MIPNRRLLRTLIIFALALPLTACGNNPQQPSDAVDDRSSQSPYGDETGNPSAADPEVASVEDEATGAAFGDASSGTDNGTLFTGDVAETPEISPIAGTWVTDPADCETGGGSAITMTTERFERVGQSCEIASVISSGQGSVAATLSCPSGTAGVATSEIVKLAPQGDGTLQMNVIGTEEPPLVLERCP